jgi:hypothetical protein
LFLSFVKLLGDGSDFGYIDRGEGDLVIRGVVKLTGFVAIVSIVSVVVGDRGEEIIESPKGLLCFLLTIS